MEFIAQVETLLAMAKADLNTFNTKKTAASATKARGSFLKIKKFCDEARKQILVESKANKANKSKKLEPVEEEEEEVQEVLAAPVVVKKIRKRKT
jgi:hypothetical protein